MRYLSLYRITAPGLLAFLVAVTASTPLGSQPIPSGPPPVGVVVAVRRSVTESFEFIGRVEATDRVGLVARVNAFLETQLFREGAEVSRGDVLYRLERAPYEAEVEARRASIAQAEAQLTNARQVHERSRALLARGSGTQAAEDNAVAQERAAAAQVQVARAQLRQAEVNLDYTEIRAPIDGRIGRSAITIGNVVGPSVGVLTTIVSQDPMHVTFPVPVRTAVELRTRYATSGGFGAVAIRLRLPDGRIYQHAGSLDFADVTIGQDTDTLTLRGTIPNPVLGNSSEGTAIRELTDGQFATVLLEAVAPVLQLTIPREAVMSDQRGDFVYVVDAGNKVERRAVQLGQSTPETAVIAAGLSEGDQIVLDGLQRVRPGMQVLPGPSETNVRSADATPASPR